MPLDATKLLLLTQPPTAPTPPTPGAPPGKAKMWLVEQGQWIDFDNELNFVK